MLKRSNSRNLNSYVLFLPLVCGKYKIFIRMVDKIENYINLDYTLQWVCFQPLYQLTFLMALLASCDTRLRYGSGYIVENPALFPTSYAG